MVSARGLGSVIALAGLCFVNCALADELILPAGVDVPAACVAHVIALPLLTRNGSPAVPVTIDGHKGAAYLGFSQTTTGVFETPEKGWDREEVVKSQSVTGDGVSSYTHVRELDIGRGRTQPFRAIDMGDSGSGKIGGLTLLGVVGADILSHYDVLLDMPGRRVTLFRRGDAAGCRPMGTWLGPDTVATPLMRDEVGYNDLAQVRLNGQLVGMRLEPGSNASILRRDDALAVGVTDAMLAQDDRVRTQAGAALLGWRHHFAPVGLGSWDKGAFDVDIESAQYNLLGLQFFRDRVVLAAFDDGMLYFAPQTSAPSAPGADDGTARSPTASRLATARVGEAVGVQPSPAAN